MLAMFVVVGDGKKRVNKERMVCNDDRATEKSASEASEGQMDLHSCKWLMMVAMLCRACAKCDACCDLCGLSAGGPKQRSHAHHIERS